MANPWFRLYSEFADDPKVQMMSEANQRRLIMLFCSRCKDETLHETEMAFHWRCSETELQETKQVFLSKGFIDNDWNLLNWNRRQFVSDTSTSRVRRHRQALKQDETLHGTRETNETVTVTAPEQNRTDSEQIQKQKKPSSAEAERVYSAYPRKVGKHSALKAIQKSLKTASADDLIAAVQKQTENWQQAGTDVQFIPHPATWFNSGRYEDDANRPIVKPTYEVIYQSGDEPKPEMWGLQQ